MLRRWWGICRRRRRRRSWCELGSRGVFDVRRQMTGRQVRGGCEYDTRRLLCVEAFEGGEGAPKREMSHRDLLERRCKLPQRPEEYVQMTV